MIGHLSALVLAVPPATPAAGGRLSTAPSSSSTVAPRLLAEAIAISATRDYHLCVAIADPAGNLLAFDRNDAAASGCIDAAMAKPHSATINGTDTKALLALAYDHDPAPGTIPGIVPAVAGRPAPHASGSGQHRHRRTPERARVIGFCRRTAPTSGASARLILPNRKGRSR